MDIGRWLQQTADCDEVESDAKAADLDRSRRDLQDGDKSGRSARRQGHHRRAISARSDSSLLFVQERRRGTNDAPVPVSVHAGNDAGPVPGHPRQMAAPFERRARHKTRPELYEPKRAHRVSKEVVSGPKARSKRRKSRRADKSGEDNRCREFQLQTLPKNSRLTLRASDVAGIFRHGRASLQADSGIPGLPDLTFNEMSFLQRPRLTSNTTLQPRMEAVEPRSSRERASIFFRNSDVISAHKSSGPPDRPADTANHGQEVARTPCYPVEDLAKGGSRAPSRATSILSWSGSQPLPSEPPLDRRNGLRPCFHAGGGDGRQTPRSPSIPLPQSRKSSILQEPAQPRAETSIGYDLRPAAVPPFDKDQSRMSDMGQVGMSRPFREGLFETMTSDLLDRVHQAVTEMPILMYESTVVTDVPHGTPPNTDSNREVVFDDTKGPDDHLRPSTDQQQEPPAKTTKLPVKASEIRKNTRLATPELLGPARCHVDLWRDCTYVAPDELIRSPSPQFEQDMPKDMFDEEKALDEERGQDVPSELDMVTIQADVESYSRPLEMFLGGSKHEGLSDALPTESHEFGGIHGFEAWEWSNFRTLPVLDIDEEDPLPEFWKPHRLY